jgi:hypothetical protein
VPTRLSVTTTALLSALANITTEIREANLTTSTVAFSIGVLASFELGFGLWDWGCKGNWGPSNKDSKDMWKLHLGWKIWVAKTDNNQNWIVSTEAESKQQFQRL